MKTLLSTILLLATFNLVAQVDFHAGHLSATQTGPLALQIDVKLYTSADSPIDTINLCFGDGVCKRIAVMSQQPINQLGLTESLFQTTHTYAGQAFYKISMLDCCWSGDGLNTSDYAGSPFELFLEYVFFDPNFSGPNSSPVDAGEINLITGNYNEALSNGSAFFDPDGDSLSLQFIVPYADSAAYETYQFPDEINPGSNNVFTIVENGFHWDSPQAAGKYHIGYELTEYRNGSPIAKSYGVSLIEVQDLSRVNETFGGKFKIYPNPAGDLVFVEGETFDRLEVYSLSGEMLLSQNATLNTINLSDLPAGVYVVSIVQVEKKYATLIEKL